MTEHPATEPAAPDRAALQGARVLLGVSGGVAAYKAALLARGLVTHGAQVQAVLTDAAARFVTPAQLAALTGRPVPTDLFEDAHRIVHVDLARQADVAVVAPATANVLGKLAHGLADDLLSSALLCLDAPLVLAPAMHTEMWEHPAVTATVAMLRERGALMVGPDHGPLAGGDHGPGRLAEEDAILDAVAAALGPSTAPAQATASTQPTAGDEPLAGIHAVVTAGATREHLDPVRYLTNRASGRMGYAVASALARRGAQVELIAGPGEQPDPAGVTVQRVETAREMHAAVLARADVADVVVGAAAVADFRPAETAAHKRKKGAPDETEQLTLVRNPDILGDVGARKRPGQVLVGFAAETHDEEAQGADKLARKGLDLIVVNRVDAPDAGFAVDTNRGLLLGADGTRAELPLMRKDALADRLVEAIVARLPSRDLPQTNADR